LPVYQLSNYSRQNVPSRKKGDDTQLTGLIGKGLATKKIREAEFADSIRRKGEMKERRKNEGIEGPIFTCRSAAIGEVEWVK